MYGTVDQTLGFYWAGFALFEGEEAAGQEHTHSRNRHKRVGLLLFPPVTGMQGGRLVGRPKKRIGWADFGWLVHGGAWLVQYLVWEAVTELPVLVANVTVVAPNDGEPIPNDGVANLQTRWCWNSEYSVNEVQERKFSFSLNLPFVFLHVPFCMFLFLS